MIELAIGAGIKTREGVQLRRLSADFPGWSASNFKDHLLPTPTGMRGVVTRITQHGYAPYTRYHVTLTDGTRLVNAVWGVDFDAFH